MRNNNNKKRLRIKELNFTALTILLLLLSLLLLFITSMQGTCNYILETNSVSWAHVVTALR
jgi:hypothetical protein